jgi:hypothetical protein
MSLSVPQKSKTYYWNATLMNSVIQYIGVEPGRKAQEERLHFDYTRKICS